MNIDRDVIVSAARGRWHDIYASLLGWPAETITRLANRKGGPCPACGGTDRFAPLKSFADDGALLCRHCLPRGGDGLAALQHFGGWTFRETLERLGELLGHANGREHGNAARRGVNTAAHVNGRTNGKALALAPRKPSPKDSKQKPERSWSTLDALLSDVYGRQFGKPSQVYHYTNAEGQEVGAVVRWDQVTPKEIKQVSLVDGKWQAKAMPEPRPLYNLPSIADAETVCVAEGEKCCDALISLGIVATYSAGGANAASKSDWAPLEAKRVIAFPDADKPGEAYLQTVNTAIKGIAKSVVVIRLTHPEGATPEGYDVADWVQDCRDLLGWSDPEIVAELRRLAAEAKEETEKSSEPPPQTKSRQADLVPMSQFAPKKIDWLWRGRIARGCVTLLVGRPGEGKSYIATDIAARVSRGRDWPDYSSAPIGDVLLMAAEDDPSFTIRPRLDACGADVDKVQLLRGGINADKTDQWRINMSDIDIIQDAIERLPDCALVVVDPIGSFLGGKTDAHRDNEVRGMLTPLADIARERNVAVLIVCHTRKSASNSNNNAPLDDGVLGSVAFAGLARNVWHVVRDEQGRGFFRPGKSNLCRPAEPLGFAIEGDPAAVSWRTLGEDEIAQLETPREPTKRGPEAEALTEATDWLREQLARGPLTRREIEDRLRDEPFGLATLKRAKAALGVNARREGRDSLWSLPEGDLVQAYE